MASQGTHTAVTVPLPTSPVGSLTAPGCKPLKAKGSHEHLPGTNITLHWMFILVGVICLALACLGCLLNVISHLVWRSNMKQQKHLMRIVILPVVFCVFSWCSIDFYGLETWLDPIPKLYEIYCVLNFYELMVDVLVTANAPNLTEFFVGAERRDRRHKKRKHENGSLRWYRVRRMSMYFALFLLAILTVLQEVISSTECSTSKAREIADVAIEIISFVATVTALSTMIQTYRRFIKEFQGTHLLRRMWNFKALVLVCIHVELIFEIIDFTKAVKPTKYMTLADFEYGVEEFILCVVSFIFAWGYLIFLSGYPYRAGQHERYMRTQDPNTVSDASVWRYLATLFFPWDIFVGFWESLQVFASLFQGRKNYDYTGGTGIGWKERQDIQSGLKESKDSENEGRAPFEPMTTA